MKEIDVLNDRVLIERSEADTETPGGIILPDAFQAVPQTGKVINVGPGKLREDGMRQNMSVKKFDTVLFMSYSGEKVKVNGKEYLVLQESDIIAIIRE